MTHKDLVSPLQIMRFLTLDLIPCGMRAMQHQQETPHTPLFS